MSFQGDVRGIGLAELLQGLARGRKEGVLTLSSTTKSGLRSTLGLEEGKAYLLPAKDEDSEIWRARGRDAWADDTTRRVDHLVMSDIARAQRLENLYELLDGGGVHFRFEPGVLPKPESAVAEEVHCDGVLVEFLLLEYARLADELQGEPQAHLIPSDVIPCLLDESAAQNSPEAFIASCNGTLTLREIADRMGWPIRQTRLTLAPTLRSGAVRLAHPSEVIGQALAELGHKRFSRAAVRLTAWCRYGQPGPVPADVAERLANEWLGARLTAALQAMPPPARRTLMRRLDHALKNPSQSVVHWLELSRMDKTDRVARLKRMAAEFREGSDPERPSVRELLDLSREFRDRGVPGRGAPLLVMAAHLQPANMTLQLELGTGLVAAGRPLEGAPWILAGGRELLDQGHADRAVAPLRALLDKDPRNRECRQLLNRARRQSTQVKKLRKNLLAGLAGAVVLSGAAVVKIQRDVVFNRKLEEVRALLPNPEMARTKLLAHFQGNDSQAVRQLRAQIEERERLKEFEQRSSWLATYHDAQLESTRGDPMLALEKIRALRPPPNLRLIREPWPLKKDLYQGLVDHFFEELEALGPPIEGSPQQIARENQIDEQADTVLVSLLPESQSAPGLEPFIERLRAVRAKVVARQDRREEKHNNRILEENLEKQEELYANAKFYTKNGDFTRAIQLYEEILRLDVTGKVARVLEGELREVKRKRDAWKEARQLAGKGQHEKAYQALARAFDDPGGFIMPWTVDSYPSHVRVEVERSTTKNLYTTPFDIETTFGESVRLTFRREGFEPRTLIVDRPQKLFVHLSRGCERQWKGLGRIDAIPVSVGEDHILVDRKGAVARVGVGGEVRWETRIETLSGIARAPVFMPARPGSLLMVSEDGAAWIIDAKSGKLEGPWDLGSAPLVGPAPTAGQVGVRLSDGRTVLWRFSLEPAHDGADQGEWNVADEADYRYGSDSGFQVARRRSGATERFECPFNDWVVEVEADAFVVFRRGNRGAGYSILREGEWEYLAWESATGLAPQGRLWVSDAGGVRSYEPLKLQTTPH